MTIQEFAAKYRLKTRHITVFKGEQVYDIPGKHGEIYEGDEEFLGVLFAPPSKTDKCGRWCPRKWGKVKRAGLAVGMILRQNGDSEGCLLFEPTNQVQSKLAIKISGVRRKRAVSPESAARLALNRQKSRVERHSRLLESREML